MLENSKLCISCGQNYTNHASGVCNDCRPQTDGPKRSICVICGTKQTSHPSGICYRCRRSSSQATDAMESQTTRLDKLIRDTEISLFILKRRAAGASISAIATSLGMAKSSVYQRYCTMVNTMPKKFIDNDGEIVDPGEPLSREEMFMGDVVLPKIPAPRER